MARQKNRNAGKQRGRGGAGQNRAETEAFLLKNRSRPDVVETASGLQYTMKEGGKCRFVVPPDLAWGKRGAGKKIGPNATLIFDIRLERVID